MLLGNKTEITQTGQAISINSIASSSLSQIFSSCIGPKGKYKMLISPSGEIQITNEGITLLHNLNFNHPTCLVINKAASQTYNLIGDGVSTFIFFCSEIFNKSYNYQKNGANIQNIVSGIKVGIKNLNEYLNSIKIPLNANNNAEEMLYKLALTSLKTKLKPKTAESISKLAVDSFLSMSKKQDFNQNMLEIIEMEEGDISESKFINGLVLDHAGRHYAMPKVLENNLIIISNISLEYEKVEINAGFFYKTAEQRHDMAKNERSHILKRAEKVVEFANKIKKEFNKNIIFITDKGIDPFSLEILAKNNILGLRRAKRRNLERLLKMCGGDLITKVEDLRYESLGECKKISVKETKENKFTFIEGTPFSGSCSILVRGNNRHEMKRISTAIRGAHKSLSLSLKRPFYLKGGPSLFFNIQKHLSSIKTDNISEMLGIKIVKEVCLEMSKILLKNMEKNVENEIINLELGNYAEGEIIDNYSVISQVISNSSMVSVTLLLVDDIIKAGKSVQDISN